MNPNDFSQHSGTAGGEHIRLLYMEIGCLEDGGTYTESSVPGSYMPIQRIEVCTYREDFFPVGISVVRLYRGGLPDVSPPLPETLFRGPLLTFGRLFFLQTVI